MSIIIFLFLINNILTLTPCSDYLSPSYGFMNEENDLLILNSIKDKKELRIYKKDINKNNYQLNSTIYLKDFPSNKSIIIEENNIYHVYDKYNGEIIYFNEEYYSSYKYSPLDVYKENIVSFLDNNKFIISVFNIIYSQINIFQFLLNNQNKFNNTKTINRRDISYPDNIKIFKCISIKNNTICGYIYSDSDSKKDFFYMFILDSNNTKNGEDTKIYEYDASSAFAPYTKKWIELIPMGDEKVGYCVLNDNKQIYCGLVQIQNNLDIKIINAPVIIFDSLSKEKYLYLFENLCKYLKLNDNEFVIGCRVDNSRAEKNLIRIKKITINNTSFIQDEFTTFFNCTEIKYFEILKDNDNNFILLLNHNIYSNITVNEFHYYGYSTCKDIANTIYNGEKTKLDFDVFPTVNFNQSFEDINNIVFIFNDTELVSLISDKEGIITPNKTYNKNEIYFLLDSKNFDYIKNESIYSVIFSYNINENLSQRCHLDLDFYECESMCDLCTKDGKCYDKNWDEIDNDTKDENDKKSNVLVIIIISFVIIFIIVVVFVCIRKYINKNQQFNDQNNNALIQSNDFIQNKTPIVYDNNYNNNQPQLQYHNNDNNYSQNYNQIYEKNNNQNLDAPKPYYSY